MLGKVPHPESENLGLKGAFCSRNALLGLRFKGTGLREHGARAHGARPPVVERAEFALENEKRRFELGERFVAQRAQKLRFGDMRIGLRSRERSFGGVSRHFDRHALDFRKHPFLFKSAGAPQGFFFVGKRRAAKLLDGACELRPPIGERKRSVFFDKGRVSSCARLIGFAF